MVSKKEIRKYVFAKRREITQEEADRRSLSIYEKVISLPEFQEASCVYAYVDYNKEASTREIIKKAWADGKRVAVPKVTGPHEMKYYYLEDFSQLKPGAEEDAFLIVPGVAFDENRHRAGYGQGFYDRYLAGHRKHKTAAIAFEFQIVEEVPAEETDVFPDKVITESRIIV